MYKEISDEDRENLHRSHCMTLTEIDGTIYSPRGGEYASDGSSINAVIRYNSCLTQIHRLERIFQDNYSTIINFIQSCKGMKISRHWQLKLCEIKANSFLIAELTNQLIIRAQLEGDSLKIYHLPIEPHQICWQNLTRNIF